MNQFCRLKQIPKWMRLILAWILMGIGLPLFLTPIPGGSLLFTAGGMLLLCASPTLRNSLGNRVRCFPKLARRRSPLFSTCDICSKECQARLPANGITPVSIPITIQNADSSKEEVSWYRE